MGAVSYLPYAHTRSGAPVAVWNGAHAVIEHTTGANVTCQLQRANGLWYRLATRDDLRPDEPGRDAVPTTGRYLSAALTDLFPLPPGYVWGTCPDSTDQPGRAFPGRAALVPVTAATLLAALLAARAVAARRRPRPEPPPA